MLVFNPNVLGVLAKQAGAELLMMKRRKFITRAGARADLHEEILRAYRAVRTWN